MSVTEPSKDLAEELAGYPHGKVPRALRRRQILELAHELFAERGFAAVSMDELAKRAGVSKPVIYGIFGSKEGIFLEVVDELGRELTAVVVEAAAGAKSPEELLKAGSLAFFQLVEARKREWAMSFGALRGIGGDADEAVAGRIAEIRERQNTLVTGSILATAAAAGVNPDTAEAEAIAHGLNGLFEGLVNWWLSHPEASPEYLADLVADMIQPGLERLVERT